MLLAVSDLIPPYIWLRTSLWGDDRDRVLRKQDGTYTYFVPDVAYHVTKWERGFRRAINVQGSDHHGTTARVRAGLQALGVGVPFREERRRARPRAPRAPRAASSATNRRARSA